MKWLITWQPLAGNTRRTRNRAELRNLMGHSQWPSSDSEALPWGPPSSGDHICKQISLWASHSNPSSQQMHNAPRERLAPNLVWYHLFSAAVKEPPPGWVSGCEQRTKASFLPAQTTHKAWTIVDKPSFHPPWELKVVCVPQEQPSIPMYPLLCVVGFEFVLPLDFLF